MTDDERRAALETILNRMLERLGINSAQEPTMETIVTIVAMTELAKTTFSAVSACGGVRTQEILRALADSLGDVAQLAKDIKQQHAQPTVMGRVGNA